MRNISKKDWDNIVNEAFSPDAPEPNFSKKYYRRKQEILSQAEDSAERSIIMRKSGLGFAAICTASIALAGLAVWGGVNIYQVGRQIPAQNQQDEFSPANAVEIAETEPDTEPITETEAPVDEYGISVEQDGDIVKLSIPVQENETLYEVKFGYVPEGLECREDGPYALKYHNYENENDAHAITPGFCRVD